MHVVLNSLSADFTAVSFALLGEAGCFEEIGKRQAWSDERALQSAGTAQLDTLAMDVDLANSPDWMQGILQTLAMLASKGVVSPLPLHVYSAEHQYEAAFRLLQSGHNTGKVVLRFTSKSRSTLFHHSSTHVVTGGTGGLGLLTARWLLGQGADQLVLTARSPKPPSSPSAWRTSPAASRR